MAYERSVYADCAPGGEHHVPASGLLPARDQLFVDALFVIRALIPRDHGTVSLRV
jgi:hypothetical protein